MPLDRIRQTGIAIESTPGVEESLVAADYRGRRKNQNYTQDGTNYQRGVQRATLSKQPTLRDREHVMFAWEEELIGGGASTEAPWHRALRICGFAMTSLKQIDVDYSGATNPEDFEVGATIQNAGVTKTAIFVGIFGSGATRQLVYKPVSGGDFVSGETLSETKHASGAIDTSSVSTAAGYAFTPLSESIAGSTEVVPPSATIIQRVHGKVIKGISGRATGRLILRQGEAPMLGINASALPVFGSGFSWAAGDPIVVTGNPAASALNRVSKVPFVIQPAGTQDKYTPSLSEMIIEFNNDVAFEETFTDEAIGESGATDVDITDRNVSTRIDPRYVLPQAGPPYKQDVLEAVANGSLMELVLQIGDPTTSKGAIIVHGPAIQYGGSVEPGNRDGKITVPLECGFYGTDDGVDDEFALYAVHLS